MTFVFSRNVKSCTNVNCTFTYMYMFAEINLSMKEMINVHSLDDTVGVSSNVTNVKKYIQVKKGNMAPIKVDFIIEISKYSKKIQYILS